MSDGAISQDEIDALLSGVSVDGLGSPSKGGAAPHIDVAVLQKFADELKGPLVENFNKMTGASFSAENPTVEQLDREALLAKLPDIVVNILADFTSGLSGDHLYILSPEFAQKLVGLMNKEENADLDEMALSVISEAVSTHTNDEIQTLEKTGKISGIQCNPPTARNDPKAMIRIPQNQFVLFTYPLSLDGQSYTLWEAVGGEPAEKICEALGGGAPQAASGPTLNAADMAAVGSMVQPAGAAHPAGAPAAMQGFGAPPSVQSLQYPALHGNAQAAEQGNIGLIMDVFMDMTVELGRTKKQIKDILAMGEGTIIELDKVAGEPVDILVNHKPIAKGEVVVIDENFGVRVTEILSSLERVADLH